MPFCTVIDDYITLQVPLEGFRALQGISGPQRCQIHKAYGAPERLPTAHTWYNMVYLTFKIFLMLIPQLLGIYYIRDLITFEKIYFLCSFNQLDLPEYSSKEQLQERLLLAIHEGSEGFGFG